jgi:hypothetical protein
VWRVETGYQGSCPDLPSEDGLTLRIFTGSDLVLRKSNGRKGRSSFFTEFGGERSFKFGEGEHNSWRKGRIYPDSPLFNGVSYASDDRSVSPGPGILNSQLGFIGGRLCARRGRSGQVIKKNVDLVSVYFTVRDKKKQLTSQLDRREFRVLEDGKDTRTQKASLSSVSFRLL